MYDNKRQEGAYQLLVSGGIPEFDTDDGMESYLLGIQRRFSLTDGELREVGLQAVLSIMSRVRENAVHKIEDMEASLLYKAALRTGVEAKILPTEIRARFRKEGF